MNCWKCGKILFSDEKAPPVAVRYCPFCRAKQAGKWCPKCREWRSPLWTVSWDARTDYRVGVDFPGGEETVEGDVKFCAKCGSDLEVKGPPHE